MSSHFIVLLWLFGLPIAHVPERSAYGYDANGAEVSATSQVGEGAPSTSAKVWDFEGHLLAQGGVDGSGVWQGRRTTYTYDAAGLRLNQSVREADGSLVSAANYLWNSDKLVEERDENGELQARYEHGQELGPLRQDLKSEQGTGGYLSSYYLGDGQDSTRQLTDINGAVTNTFFYDTFGVELPGGQVGAAPVSTSFRYTGQQKDANGLVLPARTLLQRGHWQVPQP